VITTSACGYAKHVSGANAGIVIPETFHQRTLVAALETGHDPACLANWSRSASKYGEQSSLYQGTKRAAELIVADAAEGRHRPAGG